MPFTNPARRKTAVIRRRVDVGGIGLN